MPVKGDQDIYARQRPARVTTAGGGGHLDDVAPNALG
jgi:hypothetical protein